MQGEKGTKCDNKNKNNKRRLQKITYTFQM